MGRQTAAGSIAIFHQDSSLFGISPMTMFRMLFCRTTVICQTHGAGEFAGGCSHIGPTLTLFVMLH